MKKFGKTSELLWLFGMVFVALGVAICSKADLGVSMIAAPAFVVFDAVNPIFSFMSVGVLEYIIQGVILIILCLIIGKFNWKFLIAFAVAVLYGYTLNFFLWLLSGIELNGVTIRWAMLIIGDLVTAFGVACFFRTYMPLQVYELFVSEVSHHFNINIPKVKWCFDMALLVISILLAFLLFDDAKTFDWSTIGYSSFHSIGLGTLVTTLVNSSFITFMGKIIDKFFDPTPKFKKLECVLKIN